MAELKTTYKDDVLNTSKNTKRKFNMITNSDGTVSFEDVTEYSQVGDAFSATDVNAITEEVNALNTNITTLNSALGKQSNLPLPNSTFAYNIKDIAEDVSDHTQDIKTNRENITTNTTDIENIKTALGGQSSLPLPNSSFAYNIKDIAEDVSDHTQDIKTNRENITTNTTDIENIKTALGGQSSLPLPNSSFAYNISELLATKMQTISKGSVASLWFRDKKLGAGDGCRTGAYLVFVMTYNACAVYLCYATTGETPYASLLFKTADTDAENDIAPTISVNASNNFIITANDANQKIRSVVIPITS